MGDESDSVPAPGAPATVGWLIERALRSGDVLPDGWVIHRVERLENGSRFVVTTSRGLLRVVVELPRAGCSYHATTGELGIWVGSADDPDNLPLQRSVARIVADRLHAVERGGEAEMPTAGRQPADSSTPILFLVPGHLGDPDDLSLRALQVMASVPIIFVENGKTDEVRALLTRFNLRPREGPGAPEIVEVSDDRHQQQAVMERWRAAVAAGLDTCLFGGNEGIPGFCDPGKVLVTAATEMGDAVRIRSVGGSSALGHALMRAPVHIREFEFGGLIHSDADAERLAATLAEGRRPLVAFSHGFAVRAFLPRLLEHSGVRSGTIHLLCSFTNDDEHADAIAAASFVPPGPDALPDHQAVVVVVEPAWMRRAMRPRLRERISAWFHRRLAGHSTAPGRSAPSPAPARDARRR